MILSGIGRDRKYTLEFQEKKDSIQTDDDEYFQKSQLSSLTHKKKGSNLFISAHERFERYKLDSDPEFMTKSTIKKWHSYPIYHHKEN